MKSYIQQNSVQKFLAAHRTSSRLSALSLLLAFLSAFFPFHASANTGINEQFRLYLKGICAGTITAPPGVVWDTVALNAMCLSTNAGGSSSGTVVSANLGIADAGSGDISPKNKENYECLDDFDQKPGNKGCATGGWGLLISTQFGRSIRQDTELENGFQSDLRGLLIGLDYRFSDNLILGAAVSQTRDDATFINNAGALKTSNNILSKLSYPRQSRGFIYVSPSKGQKREAPEGG